jgi:hypothetical protein
LRDGVHVRYLGDDVREVPGVGVFQRGTVAWVKRDLALELLREDCFEAASTGIAKGVVLRIGQKASGEPNPPPAKPRGEAPPA